MIERLPTPSRSHAGSRAHRRCACTAAAAMPASAGASSANPSGAPPSPSSAPYPRTREEGPNSGYHRRQNLGILGPPGGPDAPELRPRCARVSALRRPASVGRAHRRAIGHRAHPHAPRAPCGAARRPAGPRPAPPRRGRLRLTSGHPRPAGCRVGRLTSGPTVQRGRRDPGGVRGRANGRCPCAPGAARSPIRA